MNMHWEFSVDRVGNVYFAGQAPGSLGLQDIYVARFVDGKYEKPVNAGKSINSAAGENTPFIAPDESYMIFDSPQRPGSQGGNGDLNICCFRNPDGSWGEAVNLGKKLERRSLAGQ